MSVWFSFRVLLQSTPYDVQLRNNVHFGNSTPRFSDISPGGNKSRNGGTQPEFLLFLKKMFTKSGTMYSPGYAIAIGSISKIWEEFPLTAISHSFDSCGITTSDQDLFHRQLRYFARTNEHSDDILEMNLEMKINNTIINKLNILIFFKYNKV